jgi:hypothetical protein
MNPYDPCTATLPPHMLPWTQKVRQNCLFKASCNTDMLSPSPYVPHTANPCRWQRVRQRCLCLSAAQMLQSLSWMMHGDRKRSSCSSRCVPLLLVDSTRKECADSSQKGCADSTQKECADSSQKGYADSTQKRCAGVMVSNRDRTSPTHTVCTFCLGSCV